ncbi:MAG: hypothetical protein NTU60_03090, partial [Candidatus Aminicenantes bacterium]|nr:hypothetical protein [Candidatus Aminicenantes bacterium]
MIKERARRVSGRLHSRLRHVRFLREGENIHFSLENIQPVHSGGPLFLVVLAFFFVWNTMIERGQVNIKNPAVGVGLGAFFYLALAV